MERMLGVVMDRGIGRGNGDEGVGKAGGGYTCATTMSAREAN